MGLQCTTTFICDRKGETGVSEGNSLQANPPQSWVRMNYDKMTGSTMKTTIVYLCPQCAADLEDFMAPTKF